MVGKQSTRVMRRKAYRRMRKHDEEEVDGESGGGRRLRLLRRLSVALATAVGKLSDTVCAFFIGEELIKELQNPTQLSSKDLRRRVAADLSTAAACI